jgi:hypothetical protein
MRFYTNVQLIGNQFLVRGVENGKRYEHRDEFFPLYLSKVKERNQVQNIKQVNQLKNLFNLAPFGIVVSSTRSMMMLMDLRSMEMIDTSINISQRSILKMNQV